MADAPGKQGARTWRKARSRVSRMMTTCARNSNSWAR